MPNLMYHRLNSGEHSAGKGCSIGKLWRQRGRRGGSVSLAAEHHGAVFGSTNENDGRRILHSYKAELRPEQAQDISDVTRINLLSRKSDHDQTVQYPEASNGNMACRLLHQLLR